MAGLDSLVNKRAHLFGHGNLLAILAGAGECLAAEHVHNALKGGAFADRQHHGNDAVAILGAQLIEHFAIVDMFTIDLRDGDEPRKAMLSGRVPCFFKSGGKAGHSAHDDQRAFHRVKRASHFARKIEISGNVDEVDLLAVNFDGRHGSADGDVAFGLFGIIIADGVAIFDTALAVNHAGGIEHRLNERGLAFRTVSQYSDVAYVLHHVVLHKSLLLQPHGGVL